MGSVEESPTFLAGLLRWKGCEANACFSLVAYFDAINPSTEGKRTLNADRLTSSLKVS